MTIAVDFDGTIVEHKFPQIGKEVPFAIATLKKLQKERHLLILWSVREGELWGEAVEFCRKLKADLYIDGLNVGKLPGWGAVYEMVHNRWSYERYLQEFIGKSPRNFLFSGGYLGK